LGGFDSAIPGLEARPIHSRRASSAWQALFPNYFVGAVTKTRFQLSLAVSILTGQKQSFTGTNLTGIAMDGADDLQGDPFFRIPADKTGMPALAFKAPNWITSTDISTRPQNS
jgi:hypothetical protein